MIYTSRFIDVASGVDDNYIPIAIVDSPPPWWREKKYICYNYLAPESNDKNEYKSKLYSFEAMNIVNKLLRLGHKKDIILVCYEDWQCQMISHWFSENGFDCERYKRKVKKNENQ